MNTEDKPAALASTEGFGQLPDADWLAGAYTQAWRAATVSGWTKENAARYTVPLFTADQVRSYAQQAVAAERERCAKLCEEHAKRWRSLRPMEGGTANALDDMAEWIRKA